MRKCNNVVICINDFNSEEDFEETLGRIIKDLTFNLHQIVCIKYEDCGNYIIEFDYEDKALGDCYPYWLYPDEEASIIYSNYSCEKSEEENFEEESEEDDD